MKLIYGLGNPEPSDHGSRHNVGRALVERLYSGLNARNAWVQRDDAQVLAAHGSLEGHKIVVCAPLLNMNEQGSCLAQVIQNYDVDVTRDVIVVHDDLDLPLGKIRLRRRGAPPSHLGVRSIVEALGADNFWRLRVGIENRESHIPVCGAEFVLSDFARDEQSRLAEIFARSIAVIRAWVKGEMESAFIAAR